MRRSIAVVAAALTLSLGLIASQPAAAGGGYGHKQSFTRGYGHGDSQDYSHVYSHDQRYVYQKPPPYRYPGRGYSDSTLLAAVGIVAGAKVASAYLQGPPVQQTTVVYAAPPQPRPCYQVMVPYASPYGGYYYVPQMQCY